jgi:predicted nucleic-acid-binding Zn-ribbon protein
MADKEKSEQRECPKCLKKKMVYKGPRFLTKEPVEETNAMFLGQQGREPLRLYACKKCGYCELYMNP